jgi:autotransporter-associated beta strand protein
MTESTKAILIAAALSLLASFPANSADIKEFQTKEYYSSNGLDIINAAEAYSKGFTGKDITIGINDQPVNLEHNDFELKTGSKYIGSLSLEGIDWVKKDHGTHVAGIAAAAKNDFLMHGVAFDADFISTNAFSNDSDFPKYNAYSDIKAINNSWGTGYNFDYEYDDDYDENEIKDFKNYPPDEIFDKITSELEKLGKGVDSELGPILDAINQDKLLIFGAGNYGETASGYEACAPLFKKETANNIINVTAALNSNDEIDHLERNSDGSISGDFINAPFSNFAKYSEDYTICAPGWNIWSASSSDKNSFVSESGTSMAAPFVSGGAALVQQAFPYMNSKQIGDVLLSTANNDIHLEHNFLVTIRDEKDEEVEDNGEVDPEECNVNLFYLDDRTECSKEQIIDDITAYADTLENESEGQSYAEILNADIELGRIKVYYQTPLQEFIGQGMLDVGKAVNGPGALNARRLTSENLSFKYETDERPTVMYDIDTKGYDSVWSNDIKEIRVGKLADDSIEEDLRERYKFYKANWIEPNINNPFVEKGNEGDTFAAYLTKAYVEKYNQNVDENCLEGLHVGLLKKGAGNLRLEGNNTYKGASVAVEGTLTINGSVAGDAYSDEYGTIAGKGTINGTLYNNNKAIAGDEGVGNLTMGALESKGTLTAVVNNEGNTKFIVKGKANVEGSKVTVQGLVPGESYTVLSANSISGELANGKDNSTPVTTFMSEYAKVENNEITVVSELSDEPNAIEIPAGSAVNVKFTEKHKRAFTAIKNMYLKLMSDLPNGVASYRRSLRLVTSPQQIDQIMTLINLPAAQAAPALSAVVNNAAAQSMTLVQRNSMTSDILSSHFADRFCSNTGEDALKPSLEGGNKRQATGGCCASERQDGKRVVEGDLTRVNSDSKKQTSAQGNRDWIATQSSTARNDDNDSGVSNTLSLNKISTNSVTTPTCQRQATSPQGEALENGAWFKFVYNKGEMRDGARYRGRSGIIGYDLKLTDTKSFGLFFGHGNNTLDGFEDAWAKNKIEENRFGLYSSKKNDKYSGYVFLDYGKVDNELNRNLTNLGLSTNVKYKGTLYEIGGEYKLTPKNQKNKTWKVYPYINLQFSKYK